MRCNICWNNTKSLQKYYVLKCKHVYCDKECLKRLLTKKQCLVCNFGVYDNIKENIAVIDNRKSNIMDSMKFNLNSLSSKLGSIFEFIEFQQNEEINVLKNYSKRKADMLESKLKQYHQNNNKLQKELDVKNIEIGKLKTENSRLLNNIKVLQIELKESNRKNTNYQKYISKKRETSKNSMFVNNNNNTQKLDKIPFKNNGKIKAIKYNNDVDNDNNSELSNLLQSFGKKPSFSKTISLEKASTFKDSKRSKVSLKEVLFNKKENQKNTIFSCFDNNVMGSLFQKL